MSRELEFRLTRDAAYGIWQSLETAKLNGFAAVQALSLDRLRCFFSSTACHLCQVPCSGLIHPYS